MSAPLDASPPRRSLARFVPKPKLRFLDPCREVLRFKQRARRTEEAYVDWIRRFIVWARDYSGSGDLRSGISDLKGGRAGGEWPIADSR